VNFEIGYIGKLIKHEFDSINLDEVPIYETLGGQSFASAFSQLYQQLYFNGVNASSVTAQPFFETALGGANSAFCKGFTNCTAAVAQTYGVASSGVPLIKETAVSDLWNGLSKQSSWILPRTTYGVASAGAGNPQATSIDMIASNGYGSYNALFASVRMNNWHGITTTSNFTWGRALGTGIQVQASSSMTLLNPFNVGANYGPQNFDYKFIYNQTMYYDVPFYKNQQGVLGHILGGWTIAPLFYAQSGGVSNITYSEGSCTGCQAFGEVTTPGTSAYSPNSNSHAENAVALSGYTEAVSAHYGVDGTLGNNAIFGPAQVATKTISSATTALYGLNEFANPAAVYGQFRPCILGFDTRCGGGTGNLRGFPTWNLDAQVVKNINVYK
jgi:hypothetical protein